MAGPWAEFGRIALLNSAFSASVNHPNATPHQLCTMNGIVDVLLQTVYYSCGAVVETLGREERDLLRGGVRPRSEVIIREVVNPLWRRCCYRVGLSKEAQAKQGGVRKGLRSQAVNALSWLWLLRDRRYWTLSANQPEESAEDSCRRSGKHPTIAQLVPW